MRGNPKDNDNTENTNFRITNSEPVSNMDKSYEDVDYECPDDFETGQIYDENDYSSYL